MDEDAIERIKIGSNKICISEDLAKEKMVFSQESSQTIFEMGNVELIELKTSQMQCASCLHCVFKGTILCACGRHIEPAQEMIRLFKAAFGILKAPLLPCVCGYCKGLQTRPELIAGTHHHKAEDALRGMKTAEENLRRSGIDGKMMKSIRSPSLPIIGRMLG